MIQRIQTVYLLAVTFIGAFLLTGSVITFSVNEGEIIKFTAGTVYLVKGEERVTLEKTYPLAGTIILTAVLSFAAIFLFKRRAIQLWIARIVMTGCLVIIVLGAIYWNMISLKFSASLLSGYKIPVPLVMFILSLLAARAISKDEKLVRSYDRLR
jgi:hypothetical protein